MRMLRWGAWAAVQACKCETLERGTSGCWSATQGLQVGFGYNIGRSEGRTAGQVTPQQYVGAPYQFTS
jgi:hypothetical protein